MCGVLQQTPLVQATQPGLIPACVQVARPHPRLSSPDPQPPRGDFSCLCDLCCGPLLACSFDAQHVVDPFEGLAGKPFVPYFDGLTPRSPPVGEALLHQLGVLRSIPVRPRCCDILCIQFNA